MTAKQRATVRSSAELVGETDLPRLDSHVVQPAEYEELPELTDAMMEAAEIRRGAELVRRGRPRSQAPKKLVSIRLDPDVLEGLRSTGPGWQTRLNALARDWLRSRQ